MSTRASKNIITFKYYGQNGEFIATVIFKVRMSTKTCNVSLTNDDMSTISYAASPNGYYYVRTRRRPSCLPARLLIPVDGEISCMYGGDESSHGIAGHPRELAHLEAMNTNFIEMAEVTYSAPVLEFLRTSCNSERAKQDNDNESWRRNVERNKYAANARAAMFETHMEVNRLMNEPNNKYATDVISKSEYMARCSEFYDKVHEFDQSMKRALVRWPEELELPCLGDGGDLGEIVLGAMEEEDAT